MASKYMFQHRLVMEGVLRHLLRKRQGHVHHKNERKTDNRASNLEFLDKNSHMAIHAPERNLRSLTEDQVRRALEGRTTEAAAALLGVHIQTLYNRFDHLLVKRISPGGLYPDEVVEAVRSLAVDPNVGTREASRRLDMSQVTMRQIRKRHEIDWVSAPLGRPSRKA